MIKDKLTKYFKYQCLLYYTEENIITLYKKWLLHYTRVMISALSRSNDYFGHCCGKYSKSPLFSNN